MSATTVQEGLRERLATVAGLEANELGLPQDTIVTPGIYTALAGFKREPEGTQRKMHYAYVSRLVVPWQNFPRDEAALISFVNPICAAVDASAKLGGRVPQGWATITEGRSGYITIRGKRYRFLDFISDTLEKGEYQSGI